MNPLLERGPILAAPDEHAALEQLRAVLEASAGNGGPPLRLLDAQGRAIPLPHSLHDALRQIAEYAAHDEGFRIVPVATELTTQQAADILNVQHSYLLTL